MRSYRHSLPLLLLIALLLVGSGCGVSTDKAPERPALLPLPAEVVWGDDAVVPLLPSHTILLPEKSEGMLLLARQLSDDLEAAGLPALQPVTEGEGAAVVCRIDSAGLPTPGSYRLRTAKEGTAITAADAEGVGYAIQTLRQLILPGGVAATEIADAPRFAYRGLMLDESRHFFGMEEVKRLLDEMQRYKLNRLHWHLTDAGGWRLQLECRPRLTAETAYRTESEWVKWWIDGDRRYLPAGTEDAYGGFYTREEVQELVAYAAVRGIEVIPEIEMPGHSEEVLHAYPELRCTGPGAERSGDFCVGNPETYAFVGEVLREVTDLFPSAYIHIGGDEAGKSAWRECPRCRELMRREGLKDVDELQGYFIRRVGEMVEAEGRHFIGWDEILDGGLAPGAVVMSWRGMEGGLEALRTGHPVVMTPSPFCYLDYYQEDPLTVDYESNEGYCDLGMTYGLDPAPDSLSAEEQALVLGVQGNMWTEYVRSDEALEYKLFPRLLAIAEIGWTPQAQRSWEGFRLRVNRQIPAIRERGIHAYDLTNGLRYSTEVDQEAELIRVGWTTELAPCELHYRTDGAMPTADDPVLSETDRIEVRDSAEIVVRQFREEVPIGEPVRMRADYHRAIGKPIRWLTPVEGKYDGGGFDTVMTDGYLGSVSFGDGRWLGNIVTPSNVGILDMGEVTHVSSVTTRVMHNTIPGIYAPEWVELSVSSDGETWKPVERIPSEMDPEERKLRFETFAFHPDADCRYLRIEYRESEPGRFLFTDELIVW